MAAEVRDNLEGQRYEATVRGSLEDVRQRGLEVLPFCPFVNAHIQEHREYVDLAPESRREGFDL